MSNVAKKVAEELSDLNRISSDIEKGNTPFDKDLRSLAVGFARARKNEEENIVYKSFTDQLKYSLIGDVIDSIITKGATNVQMTYSSQLAEHRDEALKELSQKESEALAYLDTIDISGLRKIIRAYLDGKCLKDIVEIAKMNSPIRFLMLNPILFPHPDAFKKQWKLVKSNDLGSNS